MVVAVTHVAFNNISRKNEVVPRDRLNFYVQDRKRVSWN